MNKFQTKPEKIYRQSYDSVEKPSDQAFAVVQILNCVDWGKYLDKHPHFTLELQTTFGSLSELLGELISKSSSNAEIVCSDLETIYKGIQEIDTLISEYINHEPNQMIIYKFKDVLKGLSDELHILSEVKEK